MLVNQNIWNYCWLTFLSYIETVGYLYLVRGFNPSVISLYLFFCIHYCSVHLELFFILVQFIWAWITCIAWHNKIFPSITDAVIIARACQKPGMNRDVNLFHELDKTSTPRHLFTRKTVPTHAVVITSEQHAYSHITYNIITLCFVIQNNPVKMFMLKMFFCLRSQNNLIPNFPTWYVYCPLIHFPLKRLSYVRRMKISWCN